MKKLSIIVLSLFIGCGIVEQHQPRMTTHGTLIFDVSTSYNDCSDDAGPDIQTAIDAVIAAGGGEVYIPAGCYLIQTPLVGLAGYASASGTTASFKISGERSATLIVPDIGDESDVLFINSGTVGASVEISHLTWLGKRFLDCSDYHLAVCGSPLEVGARHLINVEGSFSTVLIEDIRVHAMWVSGSMIRAHNLETTIIDTGFYASYALGYGNTGFILLDEVKSSNIDGIDAIDYTTITTPDGDEVYTSGAAAWAAIFIKPRRGELGGYSDPTSWHSIRRVYCDEGTQTCISGFGNYRGQYLHIDGMQSSVASLTGAMGVYLDGWDNVEIERSVCGYTLSDRDCIYLTNVDYVRLHLVESDSGSGARDVFATNSVGYLEIDQCSFDEVVSSAELTKIINNGAAMCDPSPCP